MARRWPFSKILLQKRAQSAHHPSKAGVVPMRAEAEAARKLASLPDSHPPQQMQPHPNKRVCGQRRAKSLSHSQSPTLPSIAGASEGPGGTEDSEAVSLWERASSVCSVRSVGTSCFLLPHFGGEKVQTEHVLREA